jgi:hypothetical protein
MLEFRVGVATLAVMDPFTGFKDVDGIWIWLDGWVWTNSRFGKRR